MQKWDVLKSEYIFRNLHCNIRADNCLLSNGRIVGNYIVNEYPDWVNIVAVTSGGQMVLVKQYRHGSRDFSLEIPGGVVNRGEDIHSAAARELQEETGYVTDKTPIMIGSFYTNPANATNQVHTFLLTGVERQYDQSTDDTEDIEVVLAPFEDVDALIARGEIKHLFAAAALLMVKNYLANQ